MEKLSKFDRLFEGQKQTLITEADYFSTLSEHSGEKGWLNENHLMKLLKRYLPRKFGVGTGFIVSNVSFNKNNGPQLDIVIYDSLNNSPLYQSDEFGIFPIEMVYAYIEVKTTLTVDGLRRSLSANKAVRDLAKDKGYVGKQGNQLAPRFYLFAYKSDIPERSLKEKVMEACRAEPESHPHGVYVVQQDALISRLALGKASELAVISYDSAFPVFLNRVRNDCDTMINQKPNRGGSEALTLPMTDITRYFPKLEKVLKSET